MKKLTVAFLTVLATFLLSSVALADTLYLRDGRSFHGTLIGFVNGRFAFRVIDPNRRTVMPTTTQPVSQREPIARDEGEIRFFRPGEVERVEIDGRSLDELKFETRTVDVPLGPNWVDSGIDLRQRTSPGNGVGNHSGRSVTNHSRRIANNRSLCTASDGC